MSTGFAQDAFTGGTGENLQTSTVELIGKAATKIDELATAMAEAKDTDTSRWTALDTERKAQAQLLDELKAKHDKDLRDHAQAEALAEAAAAKVYAQGLREPSKARQIGNGSVIVPTMAGYAKGAFVYNLWLAGPQAALDGAFDADRLAARQRLVDMSGFQGVSPESKGTIGDAAIRGLGDGSQGEHHAAPSSGGGWLIPEDAILAHMSRAQKATLGTTSSTGGILIPNAVITDIVKPGRYRSAVTGLVNAIRGVSAYQTQIPVRASSPSRAVVALWGDTKENTNLPYGGYTATMYTLARIYDVAKQFLRFSAGAAEQDILQELAHAFELGEAYYTLQGSGSNEPYGIQTAIGTAFGAYTSSFTPSATTLAGSIATALATAAGALAVRNRQPEASLLGPAAYWTMVSQGTDSAGFFFAPAGGPSDIRPGTLVSPFGIPVYSESQLAGTDDLLVGEFSALKVYFGESYRVDTSDQAGDRWDKNLVGFRGEEEMGLDARPAVFTGAFQFIADVLP